MPTNTLLTQAEAVRSDLARLRADLTALLGSVGGAIQASIAPRLDEPIKALASQIEPLLALLGSVRSGAGVEAPRRGPGRPRKVAIATDDATPAKPRRKRRGGRGRRLNLTAESIQAALKESGGNKSAAARNLGVSQPTFYKYLAALGGAGASQKAGKEAASTARTHKPGRRGRRSKR